MKETPERICEALEWLTGHKWADNGMLRGKPLFACADGDQSFEWDSEDGYCLHRGWFKRNIEDELAHALEVTAPWEWTGHYARVPSLSVESACFRVAPDDTTGNDRFTWMLSLVNGPTMQDFEFSEDATKTAARAAYLTWMRGRFAMKGCMA